MSFARSAISITSEESLVSPDIQESDPEWAME